MYSQTMLASAARTADSDVGGEDAISDRLDSAAVEFRLSVTAAATAVDDTLDVFIQTTLDGTNWFDVVHFTQVLGNGGAKVYIAKIVRDLAQAEFELATSLGAAAVRHIIGQKYRPRWAIADADADNASFTFSITAHFTP